MHRYTADGLVSDAVKGKAVVVVAPTMREARVTFIETSRRPSVMEGEGISRVFYASGRERIETEAGGSVEFTSTGSVRMGRLRGRSLDVIFVEPGAYVDPVEAWPSLVARSGELLRP